MAKKKRPNVWEIENYFYKDDNEKNKILKIIDKLYDDYWKDILSRKITRQEFNEVSNHIWTLNEQNLKDVHFLVAHDKSYGSDDRLLCSIFKNEKFSKNVDVDIIALKSCLIDFTNSTNLNKHRNIVTLEQIAIGISNLNFDDRLEKQGIDLVKDIACLDKSNSVRLWSFASKYVLYHDYYVNSGDNYVIYDNVLKNNLWRYNPEKIGKTMIANLFEKKNKDPNPYKTYFELINEILNKYNINCDHRRRLFDHFIWWQFKGLRIIDEK